MAQELYSVEQVAERLGLHVRTVRNYVRDGRLTAVRIGKQYRIARADLDAFTGGVLPEPEPVRRTRRVEVSTIVEVDALDPATANRLATLLHGAAGNRPGDDQQLQLQTSYDEERARMKIMVMGGLAASIEVLRMVDLLGGQQ